MRTLFLLTALGLPSIGFGMEQLSAQDTVTINNASSYTIKDLVVKFKNPSKKVRTETLEKDQSITIKIPTGAKLAKIKPKTCIDVDCNSAPCHGRLKIDDPTKRIFVITNAAPEAVKTAYGPHGVEKKKTITKPRKRLVQIQ